MLENLGEFHCTCRFYRAGEFVPAVLIPESECGYHSTMRKRSTEAEGEPAIRPTQEAADAFWRYWRRNGIPHVHGYYESTWGAINAALRTSGVVQHKYGSTLREMLDSGHEPSPGVSDHAEGVSNDVYLRSDIPPTGDPHE